MKLTFFYCYNNFNPADGFQGANNYRSPDMRSITAPCPTSCEPTGCTAMGQEGQRSIGGVCARKRTKLAETTGKQTRILRYACIHYSHLKHLAYAYMV